MSVRPFAEEANSFSLSSYFEGASKTENQSLANQVTSKLKIVPTAMTPSSDRITFASPFYSNIGVSSTNPNNREKHKETNRTKDIDIQSYLLMEKRLHEAQSSLAKMAQKLTATETAVLRANREIMDSNTRTRVITHDFNTQKEELETLRSEKYKFESQQEKINLQSQCMSMASSENDILQAKLMEEQTKCHVLVDFKRKIMNNNMSDTPHLVVKKDMEETIHNLRSTYKMHESELLQQLRESQAQLSDITKQSVKYQNEATMAQELLSKYTSSSVTEDVIPSLVDDSVEAAASTEARVEASLVDGSVEAAASTEARVEASLVDDSVEAAASTEARVEASLVDESVELPRFVHEYKALKQRLDANMTKLENDPDSIRLQMNSCSLQSDCQRMSTFLLNGKTEPCALATEDIGMSIESCCTENDVTCDTSSEIGSNSALDKHNIMYSIMTDTDNDTCSSAPTIGSTASNMIKATQSDLMNSLIFHTLYYRLNAGEITGIDIDDNGKATASAI